MFNLKFVELVDKNALGSCYLAKVPAIPINKYVIDDCASHGTNLGLCCNCEAQEIAVILWFLDYATDVFWE